MIISTIRRTKRKRRITKACKNNKNKSKNNKKHIIIVLGKILEEKKIKVTTKFKKIRNIALKRLSFLVSSRKTKAKE